MSEHHVSVGEFLPVRSVDRRGVVRHPVGFNEFVVAVDVAVLHVVLQHGDAAPLRRPSVLHVYGVRPEEGATDAAVHHDGAEDEEAAPVAVVDVHRMHDGREDEGAESRSDRGESHRYRLPLVEVLADDDVAGNVDGAQPRPWGQQINTVYNLSLAARSTRPSTTSVETIQWRIYFQRKRMLRSRQASRISYTRFPTRH